MINGKELRLRNYITIPTSPITMVYGLKITHQPNDGDGFIISTGGTEVNFNFCNPIPITPEILKKFGFQFIPDWDYPDHSKGDAYIKKPYIISETEPNVYGLAWYIGGIFSTCPAALKYVHQLQNILFSVDEKEHEFDI